MLLLARDKFEVYSFDMNGSDRTITFSGKCHTRTLMGVLCTVGQTGISPLVPFAFKGNAGYTDIGDIYIIGGVDNVFTVSGKVLTLKNYGGGWGRYYMIFIKDHADLSWVYE